MEFDDFKAQWKEAGQQPKTAAELSLMTKVKHHPQLKRIRIKLIIEAVLLIGFLLVYNDIFDGPSKPLWVNIALVVGTALFILNDVIGYFSLRNPIKGNNLLESLKKFKTTLRRLSLLSVASSLVFGCSLILFLTSTINFNSSKYLMLAGMLITLLAMTYLSYSNWSGRIKQISSTLEEFSTNT